jgi:predicted Zn finger-like uncharacterized protein
MPLATRCSHCGNQFLVYAQQLRVRRGRVQCPRCGESVDALAGLLDEPGFGGDPRSFAGRAPAGRMRRAPEPRDSWSPAASMVPAAAPISGQVRSSLVTGALAVRGHSTGAGAVRWVWVGAALILTLTLAGQVLWWWRVDILTDPHGFAAMNTLCRYLGCAALPPRLSGALALSDPSLVPDAADEALTLHLRIVNTAALPQPAPDLELELYDGQGELSAARRFTPQEYDAPAPLAPGETRNLALVLSPPAVEVSGFKVRLW